MNAAQVKLRLLDSGDPEAESEKKVLNRQGLAFIFFFPLASPLPAFLADRLKLMVYGSELGGTASRIKLE